MSTFGKWSTAVAGLLIAASLVSPAQAADARKSVTKKQGTVLAYLVRSSQPVYVQTSAGLYMAAGMVQTMPDSIARVRTLEDGATVLIGPNSKVDVEKLDPSEMVQEVKVEQGSVRATLSRRAPGQQFRVRTNSAVLAARGTVFTVQVTGSGSSSTPQPLAIQPGAQELLGQAAAGTTLVQVFEGTVDVYGADGQTQLGSLGTGDNAIIPSGGTISINDAGFKFEGLPAEFEEKVPYEWEPEISTYFDSTTGPTGFNADPIETTGGPILIAPAAETGGSLQLHIQVP